MTIEARAVPIAHVVRSGVVESVHHGHVVALSPSGEVVASLGDPDAVVFARSALKPLQTVAMLRSGLDLDDELLALASSSHSGEDFHLDGVRRILAKAGLTEADLQNTPDYPLDDDARVAWRAAGRPKESIAGNCSGKHAAMLATCVAAGWDTASYRSPDHTLQHEIGATIEEMTGDPELDHTTVDGCGAPLFSCTLSGLARAFSRIATARADAPGDDWTEARVASAISAHPEWLGGTGRDVTELIAGIPGLVAKDGAEGMYAAALPDGRAVALKVLDGSQRPARVVLAAALRALGVDAPVLHKVGRVDVLGHGRPVGAVRPLL